MSKTHLTVGIATALAVCRPTSIGGIYAAVIGGATGGILCDIECRSRKGMRDALVGRIIAAVLSLALLIADYTMNAGICEHILQQDKYTIMLGSGILLITCIIGRRSSHRTFTHSLLYVMLISLGIYIITPMIGIPCLYGGISHLIIDTFNKKEVPWFYPFVKKGICFRLCYASKTANTVIMWVGLVFCIGLLVWRISVIA